MSETYLPSLPLILVEDAVKAALLEDLGRAGDITSQATIAPHLTASAQMNVREEGVAAGMGLAEVAFRLIEPQIRFEALVRDGDRMHPGMAMARISGPARGMLSGERVALNFLMHLSGVATYTSKFADEIAHTRAKVTCTRKTLPGLRAFEKYAVRIGGGSSHRFGLDDAILIKDNHIAVAGGVMQAVKSARHFAGHLVKIEVEVDTLDQMKEALSADPDAILLDNMGPDMLAEAVKLNHAHSCLMADAYAASKSRIQLEASGNVNLSTIRAIAESGIDYISTSKITMAAPTLDIGLDIAIG
jgi:nicotinate-nucleotide pyrophosphorylase (carboxylating)